MGKRIDALDGLRGLAILLVALFHYGCNWAPPYVEANHYPFGTVYQQMPIFKYGYLGVQLFFMISGFVIFMTLERSQGMRDFFVRRWVRLFPAMLLASVIIFAAAWIIPGYPRELHGKDFLGGLTFINPYFWEKFFHISTKNLDEVFWTLYLEVQFYVLAGVLFYTLRKWILEILTLLGLLPLALRLSGAGPVADACYYLLVFDHLPWFVLGMCAWRLKDNSAIAGVWACVLLSLIAIVMQPMSLDKDMVPKLFLIVVFALVFCWPLAREFFAHRFWSGIGAVSYPLYLIHHNIGVGIMSTFVDYPLGGWAVLWPFVLIGLMVLVSAGIARAWEAPAQDWLKSRLLRTR